MSFADRLASTEWERVAWPDGPPGYLWVWFRHANLPEGLVLRIPEETDWNDPRVAEGVPVWQLIEAAGVDPADVSTWIQYGQVFDCRGDGIANLEGRVIAPVAGHDPSLFVTVNTTQTQPATPVPTTSEEMFDRIDADWSAILDLEAELTRTRKQLDEIRSRLKTLDRDFTPEEARHATPQDKREWQDARRWLKDCGNRVSMMLKEHDIGFSSNAGHREWYENTYDDFVQPRRVFEGLDEVQRQYETYRKLVTTVQSRMKAAHSYAVQNGQRKAERVIQNVQAKIREANTKRNMLGVIFD